MVRGGKLRWGVEVGSWGGGGGWKLWEWGMGYLIWGDLWRCGVGGVMWENRFSLVFSEEVGR